MYAILADIHGNLCALRSVSEDMKRFNIDGVILLGDLVDYGMRSNEVVAFLKNEFGYKIICNIWGNHEYSIMRNDYSRFSSERGAKCAKYTSSILTNQSRAYINDNMICEGISEFSINGRKCLAVHGSLDDIFWKAIGPENVCGEYLTYDVVFSGHSHYPHAFIKAYPVDDPKMRNKHMVLFINPGSVGQPRNHNPNAQYALFDVTSGSISMQSVNYDVYSEMSFYNDNIDDFYRNRIALGI